MRKSLAVWALPSLTWAATLAEFGGPTPANLSTKCKAAYEAQIPACTDKELTSKNCGTQCQGGLTLLAANLQANCRGVQGPNIITVFMQGDGTKTVCSNVEGAIPQNPPSSSSARPSTTSAAASTSTRAASKTSSSSQSTSSSSSITSSTSSVATSTSASQTRLSQTSTSTSSASSRPTEFRSGGGSPFDIDATSDAARQCCKLGGAAVALLLSGMAFAGL